MTAQDNVTNARPERLPTDLGEMRTIMAADRTLMAWIRTALSMLSFGFTIYKFLQDIQGKKPLSHADSPQQVGLFLTGLGVASMLLGTLSYWATLKDLNRTEEFRLGRPTLLVAVIISIAGVLMFISIATRLV